MNQNIKKVVELFRDNFLYCFIGTNRTGKSSIARQHIIAWKKANPGKLVIGFDPQRRFRDLIDIFIKPEDEKWAVKLLKCRNVLVVLDDLRILNEDSRPVEGLANLMYYRCDYNIDIITVFHNPGLVLNCISAYATHYFIFMTNAKEGAFKDKIPNFHLCILASEEVNKYVSLFGKGQYPIFPHIIVDCEKQRLMAIHMNNKTLK